MYRFIIAKHHLRLRSWAAKTDFDNDDDERNIGRMFIIMIVRKRLKKFSFMAF